LLLLQLADGDVLPHIPPAETEGWASENELLLLLLLLSFVLPATSRPRMAASFFSGDAHISQARA
jgi:hypothetical protein